MTAISLLDASKHLPELVESIESGREQEIIIDCNGRPAARLVPIQPNPIEHRIGVAKGAFRVPADIDANNEEVARLFLGDNRS
ncbi:prevent-host-death protein [Thiohalocapsa marina]|uniref:Prevent-host-death protein n=1 Tax=Thiohalocapsa marina TaxID=424902 RepID=A0A5M8FN74_9GAMM|nr:type II toxin-antitoxin system Phd/YefM family antitoxin [Thiohalocapsa marina]KAA6186348.1 prevent-host-death protein [Thiohalocapsa marina]